MLSRGHRGLVGPSQPARLAQAVVGASSPAVVYPTVYYFAAFVVVPVAYFAVVVPSVVAVFVVLAADVVCDGIAALSMSAIPSWDFECHRRRFEG